MVTGMCSTGARSRRRTDGTGRRRGGGGGTTRGTRVGTGTREGTGTVVGSETGMAEMADGGGTGIGVARGDAGEFFDVRGWVGGVADGLYVLMLAEPEDRAVGWKAGGGDG